MPETIAEKRKTIGNDGGRPPRVRLIDPEDEADVAVEEERRGVPMIVRKRPTRSSIFRDASLMLSTPSVRTL